MEQKTSGVAIIALIISILALILAWSAFNRAGADLGEMIEREVNEAMVEIEQEYQETERDVRNTTSDALIEAGVDASTDPE